MPKIVTLKSTEGDSLYPRTVSEAIDAGDGMSLESALHGRDFAFFRLGSYSGEERCSVGLHLGTGDSLRVGYCIEPLHTNKHHGRKDALFSDYFPMVAQRQFELPTSEMKSFPAGGVYAVADTTIARHAINLILDVADFQFEPTLLESVGAAAHGIFGGYQYGNAIYPGIATANDNAVTVVAEFTLGEGLVDIDTMLYGKFSEVKQAPDSSLVAFYTFRFSSKFAKNLTIADELGLPLPAGKNYAISRLALLWQCTLIAKFPEGSATAGRRLKSLPAGTQCQVFMCRRKIRLS